MCCHAGVKSSEEKLPAGSLFSCEPCLGQTQFARLGYLLGHLTSPTFAFLKLGTSNFTQSA